MKKIVAIFMAGVMAISLAGCVTKEGTSSDLSDSSSSTSSSSKSSSKSSSTSKVPEGSSESSTVSTPEESSSRSSSTSSEFTMPAEQSTTTSSSVPASSTKQSSSTVPKEPQSSSQSTASSTKTPQSSSKSSSSSSSKSPEPAPSDDIRSEVIVFTDYYVEITEKVLDILEKYKDIDYDDIPEETQEELNQYAQQHFRVLVLIALLGELTPAEKAYMEDIMTPLQERMEEFKNTTSLF